MALMNHVTNIPASAEPPKEKPDACRAAAYVSGIFPYYGAPCDKLFFMETVTSVFGGGFVDFSFVNAISGNDSEFFLMVLNKCFRTDVSGFLKVAALLGIPEGVLYRRGD